MERQGGDDLDDDFVPDELVALSDGEEAAHSADGDNIDRLLSADEDAEPEDEAEAERAGKAIIEKKRKRREKEKERKLKVCSLVFY